MTILQDVRFVNTSHEGNDCYIYDYWVCLPRPRCVVRLNKVDGWSPKELCSVVFEEPNEEMPADVFVWISQFQED